jgi:hypothetical protein
MIRYLAAAAFAISTAVWTVPAAAANPTREQCTCDPKPESVLNNGASVRNATVCWANVNDANQWCDITVKALEGDGRQQAVIKEFVQIKDDPSHVTTFMQDLAENAFQSDDDPATKEFFATARDQLPEVLKINSKLTGACIENFLQARKSHESFKDIEEGPFSCHIGEVTGWLRMTYRVGDVRFVLMVAPHG